MAVQLNHTLVNVRDKQESATFVADVLGLAAPTPYGPFLVVQVENDVSLDFIDVEELHPQHYAFLVDEGEFDQILDRIRERGLTFWADPFSGGRASGTPTTAAGASTGRSRAGTCSRSSPGPTAAAADLAPPPGTRLSLDAFTRSGQENGQAEVKQGRQ